MTRFGKTVFAAVSARYVRLTALTEAGSRGPWSSAAEIGLAGGAVAPPALPRAGWTAIASDEAPACPAEGVLDGNATTIWHSRYAGTPVPLPHSITIDIGDTQSIAGLSYLPRSDGLKREYRQIFYRGQHRREHVERTGRRGHLDRQYHGEDCRLCPGERPVYQVERVDGGLAIVVLGRRRPRSTCLAPRPMLGLAGRGMRQSASLLCRCPRYCCLITSCSRSPRSVPCDSIK